MKRAKATILTLSLVIISMFCLEAFAQGRGRGLQKKEQGRHHHHRKDKHDLHGRNGSHHHHRDERIVRPVYVHQHHHHCGHLVVVRRYDRPRYVYYSDYDVYYDHQRNVYITYSGRNWTVTASLPVSLHQVDLRRTHRVQVEYFDDDFVSYLDRGRPILGAVFVSR